MIARNAFGDAEAGTGGNAAVKTAFKLLVCLTVLVFIACAVSRDLAPAPAAGVTLLFVLAVLTARADLRGAPAASWPHFFALSLLGGPAYLWGYARGCCCGRKNPERSV